MDEYEKDVQMQLDEIKAELNASVLTLPASLSAGELFARMDAAGTEATDTSAAEAAALMLKKEAGSAAVISLSAAWKKRRNRMLGMAAALVVITALCYGTLIPMLTSGMGAASKSTVSSAADTAGVEAAASSSQAAVTEAAEEDGPQTLYSSQSSTAAGEEKDSGAENGSSEQPENDMLLMGGGGYGVSYQEALDGTVAVLETDSGSFGLPGTAKGLYDAADVVLIASVEPELADGYQTPVRYSCGMDIQEVIKGDAGGESSFTGFGGCCSIYEYINGSAAPEETSVRLREDFGLDDEAMDSGYVLTAIAHQPVLQSGGRYLLMLRATADGLELLESPYAVMELSGDTIFDYSGTAYGTAQDFLLKQ